MRRRYKKFLTLFLTAAMCMNTWSIPVSAEDFADETFMVEPAADDMSSAFEEENSDFLDIAEDFIFSGENEIPEDMEGEKNSEIVLEDTISDEAETVTKPEFEAESEMEQEQDFEPDLSSLETSISIASETNTLNVETEVLNGVLYYLEDGKAFVAGCDTTITTTLTVADSVKGCPVIGISQGAFHESPAKEIILPSTLEWIDYGAFNLAFNLTSITIPAGVKSIGAMAFSYCHDLKTVTFKNTTSMDFMSGGVFIGCDKLTSVNLPEKVTNFGNNMFDGCSSIRSITLPSNLTEIPDMTFMGCTSLMSVNFPMNITSVGESAFYRCSSLTEITLPDTVTSMGEYAFMHSGISKFTIPSGLKKLAPWVFYKCNSLTSITIPANITEIGDMAFYQCQNLAAVTIKNTNVALGDEVFTGTPWEKSHSSFVIHGETLISYVGNDTNVIIPDGIKTIGKGAFRNNKTMTSVTLPSGVTVIDNHAFSSCSNLTTVKLPSTLTRINDYAFEECRKLNNITLPSSLNVIGSCAFYVCTSLTSITIPSKVTRIEERTFGDCTALTTVNLPSTMTFIGGYAFVGCKALTSLSLPSGLVTLGSGVFYRTGIKSITLPAKITKISGQLFEECPNLTTVTCQGTITEIGNYAFNGTPNLSYTIPSTVTQIGAFAFTGNNKLTNLIIPNGVTAIGFNAFAACTALTSVTIPDSIQTIESEMFYNCQSLKNVTLGSKITTIKEYAFYNCPQMEMVEIPSSVTKIEKYAFGYKRNDDTRSPEKIKGFAIKGTSGSQAHTYAITNGFIFNGTPTGGTESGDITPLGKPVVKVTNNERGILLSITPMEKVSQFKIYRKVGYGSYSIYDYEYVGKYNMVYCDSYANHENGRYLTYKIVPVLASTGKESTEFTEVITMVIKPVQSFQADSKDTGVQLSWQRQDAITGYEILRKTGNGAYQSLTTIKNPDTTTYVDKTAMDQTAYSYIIRSYDYDSDDDITYYSIFTNDLLITYKKPVVEEVITVSKPTISSVTNGTNSVKVQWGAVTGVTGYELYRKTGSGAYSKIATTTGTSYEDKTVTAGTTYTYKLLAYLDKEETSYYSEFSSEKSVTTEAAEVLLDNKITASSVTKSAKASSQTFTLKASATGGTLKYSVSSTTKLSGVSGITSNKVTVDSATGKVTIPANFAGTAKIKITAGGKGVDGKTYKTVSKTITLTVNTIENTITASNFVKSYSTSAKTFAIEATRKGKGALSYSSSIKSISVSSTGDVTIKAKYIGKGTITINVAAYGIYKAASKKITVTVNPTKTTLSDITNLSGQKMKVTWKKNTSGTGYEIQYSTSSTFASGNKIVSTTYNTTTSKTISGLTKGKTYYVRVRTYKTLASGNKYKSSWSTAKSIKITK